MSLVQEETRSGVITSSFILENNREEWVLFTQGFNFEDEAGNEQVAYQDYKLDEVTKEGSKFKGEPVWKVTQVIIGETFGNPKADRSELAVGVVGLPITAQYVLTVSKKTSKAYMRCAKVYVGERTASVGNPDAKLGI